MNKNIGVQYEGTPLKVFVTQSSEDLTIPPLGFKKEEEAELAVAVAKVLKAHGKNIFNLANLMPYVFRVIGVSNAWTD